MRVVEVFRLARRLGPNIFSRLSRRSAGGGVDLVRMARFLDNLRPFWPPVSREPFTVRQPATTRDLAGRLALAASLGALGIFSAWQAWPGIGRWHQQQLAEQLAAKMNRLEDAQVKVPLRQMASCGPPAFDTLVEMAASRRAAVAALAQQILAEKVAHWRVRAAEKDDYDAALPTTRLAAVLAKRIRQFGPRGKRWAEGLTLQLIDLSDALAAPDAAIVLDACTEILAAIPPRGPRLRTIAPGSLRLEERLPALRVPQIPLEVLAVSSELAATVDGPAPPENREALADVPGTVAAPEPFVQPPRPSLPDPPRSDWLPQWKTLPQAPAVAHQGARLLPSQPPAGRPQEMAPGAEVIQVPSPAAMNRRLAELRGESSEVLLEKLARARFYESAAIREVLRQRGYDRAELATVWRIGSADSSERLQLVDRLSDLPANQARRWLRMLLTDSSADVRLRALSAMATTDDPRLFQIAQEMALGDSDSRVAELATRIMRQAR